MRYKTLWKPRHCDVVTRDGDDVTMVMEYYAVRETGMGVEMERAVAMQLKKGQTINDVKVHSHGYTELLISDEKIKSSN